MGDRFDQIKAFLIAGFQREMHHNENFLVQVDELGEGYAQVSVVWPQTCEKRQKLCTNERDVENTIEFFAKQFLGFK